MYNPKMFDQVSDYQKSFIDNSFTMMTVIQDQGLSMMNKAVEANTLIPESGRKLCTDWIDFVKQNRENFRTYIDNSYDKFNNFYEEARKSGASAKTTAKKS
jgi:glutamate/tyrosine decarboxylase-like PLP-dependent enzyme